MNKDFNNIPGIKKSKFQSECVTHRLLAFSNQSEVPLLLFQYYINQGFLAVRHLPTKSSDKSWPKNFKRNSFFNTTKKI